jgi:hypothetical protein
MACRRSGWLPESSCCSVSSKARRLARPTRVGHPVPDVAAPPAKVFRISADPGASIATSRRSQAEVQHSAWAPVSAPGSAPGLLLSRALSSAQAAPRWGRRAHAQPFTRPAIPRHSRASCNWHIISKTVPHAAKPLNSVPFPLTSIGGTGTPARKCQPRGSPGGQA